MSKKEQCKWICNTRTVNGKLETVILKFKPRVGQKLKNGNIITAVN